jgi:hypothetical protein
MTEGASLATPGNSNAHSGISKEVWRHAKGRHTLFRDSRLLVVKLLPISVRFYDVLKRMDLEFFCRLRG